MMDLLKGTVTAKDWAYNAGIIVVAALLCVAFYFVVFTSQRAKAKEWDSKHNLIRVQLRQAYTTRDNISELREKARMMKALVEEFQKRLPSERDIPRLISQLEKLGDAGLQVKMTSIVGMKDDKKETIQYQAEVVGNFHQIVGFINKLEREDRYLKVSDLDIEEKDGAVTAKFILSTFRFLEEQATASTGKPAAAVKPVGASNGQ